MNSPRPHALTDFACAVRRRKLIVILSLLVFATASAIAVRRLPNVYESSAIIGIESASTEASSQSASTDLPSRVSALRQQATNRAKLEALISEHKFLADAFEKGASTDDLISEMRSRISINPDASREDGSSAFVISYRANDPETSQTLAAELAELLIAGSATPTGSEAQATGEAEVLRQRALQLTAQLHELEQKAPWLVTMTGYVPIPSATAARAPQYSADSIRAQQMTIESLRDQQYKVQQQLADIERRLATQRQIVEQQKKGSTLRNNPTYAALIARRTELEGQRDTLINRQELTDKHPRVVGIIDQISAINRQIEELRQQDANNISQTPEARELASLESERNRFKIDLEITDREIARRLANAPTQTVSTATPAAPATRAGRDPQVAQAYIALKKSYDETMAKLEGAQSKQPAAAKGERLRLIEAASLPRGPIWPNHLLLIAIAAAAGLALGVLFAAMAERRRLRSLQTARDVEYYARLPLLAAIPKTMTRDEMRRAKRKARFRFILATTVATVATFALTKIFILTEIFSLIAKK